MGRIERCGGWRLDRGIGDHHSAGSVYTIQRRGHAWHGDLSRHGARLDYRNRTGESTHRAECVTGLR